MKWTTWIVFALAIVLALGVAAMVGRQSKTSSAEFFAAVEKRTLSSSSDRQQTLQNLDQVFDRAQREGDTELATRVQILRGKTLMEMGAFDRARADLTAVSTLRPTDVGIENDLVELEARSGDFHAAQERVKRMLDKNPRSAPTWVMLGRMHRRAADKTLEVLRTSLEKLLVVDDAKKGIALVERAVALDPSDARRVALARSLRDLLDRRDEARLEDILNSIDLCSADLKSARDAWAKALEFGLESEAVAGLIDLYERAGLTGLAVDLATATVRVTSVRADPAFGRTLLHALAELGRWRYASEIAVQWTARGSKIDGEFGLECCNALWHAKRWEQLLAATNLVIGPGKEVGIGNETQIHAAHLYAGLALIYRNDDFIAQKVDPEVVKTLWLDGRHRISIYMATEDPEPFVGARAEAYRQIARASRELGEPVAERPALQGAIELEPDHDGDQWLRLAELGMASRNGGYRLPEFRFAKGMSLEPQRTAELLPRWHDIGALELKSIGLDLEAVRQDLAHGKVWKPSSDASPYEFFRVAQIHAEVGDYLRATSHLKKLLDQVPGFVPALDLLIDIADKSNKPRDRMDALLERVARAGRSPEITEILRNVGFEDLEPSDLVAMMRADPEHTGRLAIASDLARRGRTREALALVSKLPPKSLGDEGRLLLARLQLARHESKEALATLRPIGVAIYTEPRGIEMFVEACLGAEDRDRLQDFTTKLAQMAVLPAAVSGAKTSVDEALAASKAPIVDSYRWLRLAERLITAGAPKAAMPLLERLDSHAKTRGGDVVLRLVTAALAQGDDKEVRSNLERARAFETRGATEYVALFVEADRGDLGELKALADSLAAAKFRPAPIYQAEVGLLQERYDLAAPLVDAALEKTGKSDPWWNLIAAALHALDATSPAFELDSYLGANVAHETDLFLRGPDQKRDVREAVCVLLALRDPLGAAYVQRALARMTPETHGTLWPDWIRASRTNAPESDAEVRAALERLLAHSPGFGPAWDALDKLDALAERTTKEYVALRRRRDAAMGEMSGTQAERIVDSARFKLDEGNSTEALSLAREAVALDRWSLAGRRLIATIQEQQGLPLDALATWREALRLRPPTDGRVWPPLSTEPNVDMVRDYLDAIGRAAHAGANRLTQAKLDGLIRELVEARPKDPRVVLEAANSDLTVDPRNPSLGVSRAYARLDAFRAEHANESLEKLGAGSVQAWTRFYTALDPERARAFLESELALAPATLSSWLEFGRIAEARGDVAGAERAFNLATRIAPDGAVLREILRLRAASELAPEEIDASVAKIVESDGQSAPDAELNLLAARCFMNLGPRYQARACQILDALSASRGQLGQSFQVRHGVLFASARLSRGKPDDFAPARTMLDQIAPLIDDSYTANFATALRGLSLTSVPEPVAPKPAKDSAKPAATTPKQ